MKESEIAIPFDIEHIREDNIHKLRRKAISCVKSFIKRTIEIFISIIGCMILIPLTIVVFFQNKKNHDDGNVFYVQNRIGKNGKIFKMYKYRTMVTNADDMLNDMLKDEKIKQEYETYRKLKNDPRLTKFGKVLRKTSLDEFPQFINILKGDMTFIGPRPYMPEEKEKMGTYYKYIIQHKPGISGVFQIAGREKIEFMDRLDMDYRYHYNKTLALDLKIALTTMFVTLRKKKTYDVRDMVFDTTGYIGKLITLFLKRLIDIIGAIVGIILLVPLTICVWIGNLICGDKGPTFFTQERIGKDGKNFKMYKFRTMVVNADQVLEEMLEKDPLSREEYKKYKKLKNDPRITKVGKFLRQTSLDEFPQFVNILKGEMSLVGPRAYLPKEKEDMGEMYEKITEVKPGLTGLWQVTGRSDVTFDDRLEIDRNYFENNGLIQDIQILLKTVEIVINKKGAA